MRRKISTDSERYAVRGGACNFYYAYALRGKYGCF